MTNLRKSYIFHCFHPTGARPYLQTLIDLHTHTHTHTHTWVDLNRAQEILPVNKTNRHLVVFLLYLVTEEKESVQLLRRVWVLSLTLRN